MTTKNIYEIKKDFSILKIYSKVHGLKEILFDTNDFNKIKNINWHIDKDSKFVVRGNKKENFWKTILNYQGKLFIKHKNNNEFDFRKSNLEIVKMSVISEFKKQNYLQNKNTFLFKDNYCIIQIFSKIYGIKESIIDINDYEKIKNYSWSITKDNNTFYVKTIRDYKTIILHRFILNAKKDDIIDHINHNGLDNRKENLRIVTSNQNSQNRLVKNKYIGIHKVINKKSIKWIAGITIKGKYKYLGRFKTEYEAIEARRMAELQYWGIEALKINDNNRKQIEKEY